MPYGKSRILWIGFVTGWGGGTIYMMFDTIWYHIYHANGWYGIYHSSFLEFSIKKLPGCRTCPRDYCKVQVCTKAYCEVEEQEIGLYNTF